MNKYPVYIVSKGRWENPMTAKFFLKDGVKFKIVVEPQEYDNYCKALGKKYVLKTDFSNLVINNISAADAGTYTFIASPSCQVTLDVIVDPIDCSIVETEYNINGSGKLS